MASISAVSAETLLKIPTVFLGTFRRFRLEILAIRSEKYF